MAKKIKRIVKLQFNAAQAKPGPGLASLGINMPQFCVAFNGATKTRMGDVVPVIITAYDDKSFDFVLKTTPAAVLLKRAANIEKGSSSSKKEKVATITEDKIREIAEYKIVDLNANDIEKAMKIIEGTARNMGIIVEKLSKGEQK
ncbi:50S ribosomal protein L11 [Spiroplasma endosymbiont of Agriotes lineatus]|uniref:50S ribosomal protein L11 n=1 Tax=Spiroplasma endosymbiont of Agriotes lineatus TaxID=3077930 RepID=UPI0030CF0329